LLGNALWKCDNYCNVQCGSNGNGAYADFAVTAQQVGVRRRKTGPARIKSRSTRQSTSHAYKGEITMKTKLQNELERLRTSMKDAQDRDQVSANDAAVKSISCNDESQEKLNKTIAREYLVRVDVWKKAIYMINTSDLWKLFLQIKKEEL
jgi:hypothetical protein